MTITRLGATLDTAAAGPLRAELLARIEAGEPIRLDGTDVQRAGLACLQVLASARASAEAVGLGFRLDGSSEALVAMTALAGLDALTGTEARS